MPDLTSLTCTTEIASIIQRLHRLRKRFKLVPPENITAIQKRIFASGMAGEINDVDLLYDIGIILASQSAAVTMGELSRLLDVPLSTATRIVDWLVNNDYAERLPDPDDRRIVRVQLTSAAIELYRAIDDFVMESATRLLNQLSDQDCQTFLSLLSKLLDSVEQTN